MTVFANRDMGALPLMQLSRISGFISAVVHLCRRTRRGVLGIGIACAFAQLFSPSSRAAELAIEDGVIVKFGPDAQMVVRDRLVPGKGVIFTSHRDDSVGGPIKNIAQVAAAGDWRGLRLEKSMLNAHDLVINDWWLRYGGAADGSIPGAALFIRGVSPQLQFLQVTDSIVGMALSSGAAPSVSGSSFLRNGTGVQAENASPQFSSSQFVGNTTWGLQNKTAQPFIMALGNWWGHPSGPKEPVGNPQGQGDTLTAGVEYTNFATNAPLLNPTVRLVAPAQYYGNNTVLLDLSCVNATEYRIAENQAFSGLAFKALPNGRAQIAFATSLGDGLKAIDVQFRNAEGALTTASLAGGVLIDTKAPVVSLTNPAAGSLISQPITLEASASDESGIAKVEFFLNGVLLASKTSPPYSQYWNTDASAEGAYSLRVVATDGAGRTNEQAAQVDLSRVPPPPDTEGPLVTSVTMSGQALNNGSVLSRNGLVTLTATDRSGISRVDLLLNGAVVGTATAAGSTYSVPLSLDGVANGANTLSLRATDSLTNSTDVSFSVVVTHAPPETPVITQPGAGLTTRDPSLSVSGVAKAGSSVQLFINGSPFGLVAQAGSDGRFSTSINLVSGQNQIQATATDVYGVSPLSAGVLVNLDVTVPASPSSLTALALDLGKVRLNWVRSTDANAVGQQVYRLPSMFTDIAGAERVATLTNGSTTFEDLPPADANWTYRLVAVNGAGAASLPTNAATVQSDNTPPKALSIVYTSLGKVLNGRYGQGQVNLVLTTSEAL
ncbi:MAG: hypothetical protein ING21_06970, partial [Burkholderiales bacterium]|nr:hypothetical protein [Burkholderiales bacterium]